MIMTSQLNSLQNNLMVGLNAQEKMQTNFSVTIKKELDNGKIITYKLRFIDSFRFMSISLSKLVDNLSEIYKKDCKGCKERRKN